MNYQDIIFEHHISMNNKYTKTTTRKHVDWNIISKYFFFRVEENGTAHSAGRVLEDSLMLELHIMEEESFGS